MAAVDDDPFVVSNAGEGVEFRFQTASGESITSMLLAASSTGAELKAALGPHMVAGTRVAQLVAQDAKVIQDEDVLASCLSSPVSVTVIPEDAAMLIQRLEPQLWLDASTLQAGAGVTEWRCRFGERRLVGQGSLPICRELEGGAMAVGFSFDHFGEIEPPLSLIHTIVSVHRFTPPYKTVGPFYIISGSNPSHPIPFHCDSDGKFLMDEGWRWSDGKVRHGGAGWTTPSNTTPWTTFEVASLQCSSHISAGVVTAASGLNRIGRDRNCHEFNGEIAELIVFPRELSEADLGFIEETLLMKWSCILGNR